MSSSKVISSSGSFRIGYWLAEKKIRKLNFEGFEIICRKAGVDIAKLDLDEPLEPQGPFDVIIHKLTDLIARSRHGCRDAQQNIDTFQEYILRHSDVIVIDPLENIMKLFDRLQQYSLVKQCLTLNGVKDSSCFAPSFVEFTSSDIETNLCAMKSSSVQFPVVCKPMSAHGSIHCHQMSIVFNEDGLKDAAAPCIAQTFVNHNAQLFKIYVLGEKQFVVRRPSIKNIYAGSHETLFFNSNDISKPNASSFLTQMDDSELESPVFEPDAEKLRCLTVRLQQTFGLDLFGIDVIIENVTGRYAIIDVNTFPGYEDVPGFFQHLFTFIQQKRDTTVCSRQNCVDD